MIDLEQVRRSFRSPSGETVAALDLPALHVRDGQGVVVSGPNGAGKTTLLHLIAGLLRPDSGRVTVSGRDLGALSEAELDRFRARTVGYLLQGQQLIEWLSAEENVMAAMLFAGRSAREQRGRARELLGRLDVSHRASHRPAELSGGERQRVALARALANDPPLLLADEPTASLDPAASRRMVEELTGLCIAGGHTLVVVTHAPELFGGAFDTLRLGREDDVEPGDR